MDYSYVYIITNKNHTVLYTGVTSDLLDRIRKHRSKWFDGFSSRYQLTELVYYEELPNITAAIAREKQIKNWSRQHKLDLIEKHNPCWRNLLVEDDI